MLSPKESSDTKPSPPKKRRTAHATGYKSIGTGLTSTLLSSQTTNTHRRTSPFPVRPSRGISYRSSLADPFRGVKSGSPYFVPFCGRTTALPVTRSSVVGCRQDVRCGSFPTRVPRPCSLPVDYLTRSASDVQIAFVVRVAGTITYRSPGAVIDFGSAGRPPRLARRSAVSSVSLPVIYVTPRSDLHQIDHSLRWWPVGRAP
jgi:hypothetical protein